MSKVGCRLKNATKIVGKDMGEILNLMLNNDQYSRPDWVGLERIILARVQNPTSSRPKLQTLL